MKKGLVLLAILVCAEIGFAQTARRPVAANTRSAATMNGVARPTQAANSTVLPIRRVILYSNGVAYIERRGIVTGNAEINLSFKQSQVDDVLKSMVVLDLGQGRIGAVSYNSSMPASARMSEIPFSVSSMTTDGGGVANVLGQLQGAKVAVTSPRGSVTGSILTLERKQIRDDKETQSTNLLVLVGAGGEITHIDLSEVRSIRLLDNETKQDLLDFANAAASTRRRDAKTISVTTMGSGQRELVVSYAIAAPIWKTTYRAVLDEDGRPFFQGWAIVDNISEDDWNGVQLSLVSGSPVSFIQNLQQPFFRHRPVVPAPSDLQLRPQTHEPGSVSSTIISGTVTDANGAVIPGARLTLTNDSTGQNVSLSSDRAGNFERAALGPGSHSMTIDASGFKRTVVQGVRPGQNLYIELEVGSINEAVVISSNEITDLPINTRNPLALAGMQPGIASSNFIGGAGPEVSVSDALRSEASGIITAASGSDIGDLFEYKIEQPVTILRDRSALIPIVQTNMDGERVAIYNQSVRADRPLSGVLLKNHTDLTLETGSITVLDGNAYAGEAMMERLKPQEQRLISFALDLGTHVRVRQDQGREPARFVRVVNGVFEAHYFRTEEKTYEISNQSDKRKVMYLEHPIRSGWELSDGSPKPDITTQRFYRFRVELSSFQETRLTVVERQPLRESYQLTSFTGDQLALFLSRNSLDNAVKERLQKLIALRNTIGQFNTKLAALEREKENISDDQERLRENIEALAKTSEARQLIVRYIAKANEQETRLEQIENERRAAQAEKERLERELALEIKNFEVR